MPPRHTGRVWSNATFRKPMRKKGIEDSLLGGKPGPLTGSAGITRDYSQQLFSAFFLALVQTAIFDPKNQKGFPKRAHKYQKVLKVLKKVGSKFRPRNRAWKKEVQSVRIVLPSTFWLHFQGSQAIQKACQMAPKWNPEIDKKCEQS